MVEPKRILLIRLSHLGDVVHALPVYHALRATWPRAELGWVVQPEFSDLVAGLPGIGRVLRFDRRGGAAAWLRLREELGAFQADLAVDAQGNLKSAMTALASGAARRIGLAARDWREPVGALSCHERAQPASGRHAVDRMLELARFACSGPPTPPPRFDPGVRTDERRAGQARAAELFEDGSARRVVLQLSDPDDVRGWPVEHALALIDELCEAGWSVAVLSGPGEAAIGERVARERPVSDRVRHWVGQRGLRALAGFFSAAAEFGTRFVGTDSGPMHLAWSCGMRVTTLAGPQDYALTGPWPVPRDPARAATAVTRATEPHRVVLAEPRPACAPCLSRSCSHPEGPVCMRDLRPGAVAAALSFEDASFEPSDATRGGA